MHLLAVLSWLVFLQAIRISAAPTSTSSSISTENVATGTSSVTSTTPRHGGLATAVTDSHLPDETGTTHHTLEIPPTKSLATHPVTHPHTWTWHGSPISPTQPPAVHPVPSSWSPDTSHHHRQNHQTPIVIFFEVVCGIGGLVLILSFLRCLHSYRRTPERDRIADVINRHRLQREMEEIQYTRPRRRGYPEDDPVPPYIPRPPSYIEPPLASRGPEYAELPSSSPPSSPPLPTVSLDRRRSESSSAHGSIVESTPIGMIPAQRPRV